MDFCDFKYKKKQRHIGNMALRVNNNLSTYYNYYCF